MGDFVVVREGVSESSALRFAEGGEERVRDGVVGCAEVVVALGVADEVDDGFWWHFGELCWVWWLDGLLVVGGRTMW